MNQPFPRHGEEQRIGMQQMKKYSLFLTHFFNGVVLTVFKFLDVLSDKFQVSLNKSEKHNLKLMETPKML